MSARGVMISAPVGKSGPGTSSAISSTVALRVVDQVDAGRHHLAQVVGQDVGRHADGDARRAVQQDVRQPGGERDRLAQGPVEVGHPLGRAHLELGEQHVSVGRQAGLRVAHGREVLGVVDRAPVALAVDQRVAVGKRLRQQHHGLVAGAVAVRVVLAEHVADRAGGLLVLGRRAQPQLAHGVDDAALHRLQPVADERQGPVHDDVHGIIEVGGPDEIRQRDLLDLGFHRMGFGTNHHETPSNPKFEYRNPKQYPNAANVSRAVSQGARSFGMRSMLTSM